jgi:hypothetical protein
MSEPVTAEERFDCTEGRDERPHKHAWEFEPHYDSDFDVLVCDHEDAWDELIKVVEAVYDNMEAGEQRTITIRFNGVKP